MSETEMQQWFITCGILIGMFAASCWTVFRLWMQERREGDE